VNRVAYLFVRLAYLYHRNRHDAASIAKFHHAKKLGNLATILSIWDKDVRYVEFGPDENTHSMQCGERRKDL
jgi:hypothetical protein